MKKSSTLASSNTCELLVLRHVAPERKSMRDLVAVMNLSPDPDVLVNIRLDLFSSDLLPAGPDAEAGRSQKPGIFFLVFLLRSLAATTERLNE